MRPLPHIGASVVQDDRLNLHAAAQLDASPAMLREAEAEADILESTRYTATTQLAGGGRLWRPLQLPAIAGFAPPRFAPARFEDLGHGHAGGKRRINRAYAAFANAILQADLQRVHFQGGSQSVHLTFSSQQSLGRAKAAKGAGRDVVGVHSVSIDVDVWDFVGSANGEMGVAQDFVGGVVVGAGVADDLSLYGGELAGAGCAPFRANFDRVALVMIEDGLFAVPLDFDRLTQFPTG